jgi:hypothetical protein
MLLSDIQPYAIEAATKEISQRDLTIAVAGTSGANNPKLTGILFPRMVNEGLLTKRTAGKKIFFTATQKGLYSIQRV